MYVSSSRFVSALSINRLDSLPDCTKIVPALPPHACAEDVPPAAEVVTALGSLVDSEERLGNGVGAGLGAADGLDVGEEANASDGASVTVGSDEGTR